MIIPRKKKETQNGNRLYIRVFSQYFLLIFMIFLVLSASGIVIWTAFFLSGRDTSLQTGVQVDAVSLVQIRDTLADWLRTFPLDDAELPVNQNLSAVDLHKIIASTDFEKFQGIQWIADRDRIGLKNLSGDDTRIFIKNFDGKEFQLYDGWVVWCPVWEMNCYFQLVSPENLVDLTTIKFILSD